MTYSSTVFQTSKYFALRDVICLCLRDQLESTTAIFNSSIPRISVGTWIKSAREEATICRGSTNSSHNTRDYPNKFLVTAYTNNVKLCQVCQAIHINQPYQIHLPEVQLTWFVWPTLLDITQSFIMTIPLWIKHTSVKAEFIHKK